MNQGGVARALGLGPLHCNLHGSPVATTAGSMIEGEASERATPLPTSALHGAKGHPGDT